MPNFARTFNGWAGGLMVIVLLAAAAWFFIERAQRDARAEAALGLDALVEVIVAGLNEKRRQLLADAQSFAQQPETITATRLLLDAPHSSTASTGSNGKQRIRHAVQPLLRHAMYQGFLLIGPGNTDLMSMPNGDVRPTGLLRGNSGLLERAWAGEPVVSEPELSETPVLDRYGRGLGYAPTIFSIAPIRDASGDVMALLAIRVDPWLAFFSVAASAYAGKSAKSYLFDRDGHLLAGTRFTQSLWEGGPKSHDPRAPRSLVLRGPSGAEFIHPVAEAVRGSDGVDAEGYLDHRGESVVGAWRWVDALGLGIAAEIDKKEIYERYVLSRMGGYWGTALAVFLLLIFASLSMRQQARLRRQVERQAAALHVEKMRVETFFQHAPNGMMLLDDDYRIILFSARAREIFGRPEREVLGKTIDGLFAEALPSLESLTRGERYAVQGRRSDGSVVSLDLSITETHGPKCSIRLVHLRDLTDSERLDQRIREEKREREKAEGRERQLLDAVGEGILGMDPQGRISFVNPVGSRLLGYSQHDLLGRHLDDGNDVLPLCRLDSPLLDLHRVTEGAQETSLQRSDGSWFDAEYVKTPLLDGELAYGWVVVFSDVSARERADQSLRLAEHVFWHMTEGLVVADAEGRVLRVNPALCQIVGFSEQEIVGQTCPPYRSGIHTATFYEQLWDTLIREGCWEGEVWNRRKNGDIFPTVQTIVAVKDGNGRTSHYISVTRDVTEQRRVEEHVRRLAYFDNLTGLPNRGLFQDRLEHALQRAQRHAARVALLFLDLDRFKEVNDSLGHLVGDRLLKLTAARLQGLIREEDTIARFGGDEFTVLLESVKDKASVQNVAEKIVEAISQPFEIDGHRLQIGTSIGISCYPRDGVDIVTLIKNADTAMYEAKAAGCNSYRFFSQDLAVLPDDHAQLSEKLHRALDNDEFVLHYQPQYSGGGHLMAVEALIRWQDPALGLISPERFIPLAEETDLILAIDEWVLRTACEQMRMWREAGAPDFKVAVNLSASHVMCGDIVETVAQALRQTGLSQRNLELEVTERFVMEDVEQAIDVLTRLRSLDVSLAIDVFGTGYTLLPSLRRLPVDTLKMDGDFFSETSSEANGEAIARSLVTMAHELNMKIVAERITTTKQKDFFLTQGCDAFQGFLFAQPLPADAIEQFWRMPAEATILPTQDLPISSSGSAHGPH